MDDRVLALCELSNDLLFHKIPKDALPDYVDQSLAAGRAAGRTFAGRDIMDLYQESGIKIHYKPSGKHSYGVILRGQTTMSKTECSVEIYRESIEELSKHSVYNGERLDYEGALRVHLAHEFFHFWEYRNGSTVSERLPGVTTLRVLGLRRTAKINRCQEVAAHAFAKELLSLPVLPNLYDYAYLIQSKKMQPADFDRLMADMAALLS